MPWCPKCKEEYRDGFTICIECGAELVDELGTAKKERKKLKKTKLNKEKLDDVFLVNVYGPVESTYITSMLEDAGIAYRVSQEGSGQYMDILIGASFSGQNILVSKEDYERAMEIVKSYQAAVSEEE